MFINIKYPVQLAKLMCIAILTAAVVGCASEPYYEAAPPLPMNVSPDQGAIITVNTQTTFTWRETENTHYYEFYVYNRVGDDPAQYYLKNLRPLEVCAEGLCSLTLDIVLPIANDHSWRVRAGNNAGLSEWNRNTFTTVEYGAGVGSGASPNKPRPLQPENGATVKAGSLVNFIWQSEPYATSYEFHLFNSTSGQVVDWLTDMPATTLCQDSTECQLTRSISLPVGSDHDWRVRAINENGESAWTRSVFAVTP